MYIQYIATHFIIIIVDETLAFCTLLFCCCSECMSPPLHVVFVCDGQTLLVWFQLIRVAFGPSPAILAGRNRPIGLQLDHALE